MLEQQLLCINFTGIGLTVTASGSSDRTLVDTGPNSNWLQDQYGIGFWSNYRLDTITGGYYQRV